MTRDEILTMEAGRELDALMWMALHGQEPNILVCRHVDSDYQPHAGYPSGHISPPHYSTDIAAAWEVIEKFPGASMRHTGKFWFCDLWQDDYEYSQAETAPLAICRAALLVVMETA